MKFQSEIEVVGLKSSKGEFEGTAYDTTKAYCLVAMDESKGNMRGMGIAEYTIGKSDEFAKFKDIPLPFRAVADFEIVTNGKTTKTVVHAVRPVAATPKQPPARASA